MFSGKRLFSYLFGYIVIGLLVSQMAGVASATLVALSENNSALGLNKSASLDAAFHGMGTGDMVFSTTDDTYIAKSNGSAFALNQNFSSSVLVGANGTAISMYKFDLSSLAGATIHKAQLQLWGVTGNGNITTTTFGAINSFDWTEGAVTANSPIGTPSTPEWGAGSSVFDIAGGVDVPSTSAIDTRTGFQTYPNPATGTGVIPGKVTGQNVFSLYLIEDVTASLQSMVDGSASNFGWATDQLNYNASSSESTITNGFSAASPFNSLGAETKPTLFVEYTVSAVPEPSAFLFGSLVCGLIGIRSLRRANVVNK